ncbi:MAG: hypothetical protein HYX52_09435 [Chloroflexi bacterium]|nr:hypothetical protein [Chloroflexota bacterium]
MALPRLEPVAVLRPEQQRLARRVLAGLTLVVALWLGYALGRGQSLAEVSRLYRDASTLQYTLDTGQMIVHYARTGGTLKPLLQAPDGTSLMDFSDWDYQSSVVVDGQRFEWVRLVPTDTVDYARNRIVAGLSSGTWTLSREITVSGDTATVQLTFQTTRPVQEVRVTVAHANWYYLQVTPDAQGFTATVPRATRGEIETGVVRDPTYEVRLTAEPAGERLPDLVRVGPATPFGVQSVATQYVLRNPAPGEYVRVATETVRWRRI